MITKRNEDYKTAELIGKILLNTYMKCKYNVIMIPKTCKKKKKKKESSICYRKLMIKYLTEFLGTFVLAFTILSSS